MAGFTVFVQFLLVNLLLNEEFPGVTLPWPFSEEYLTTVARQSYELRMDPSDMIPFETSHVYQSVITRLSVGRELELQLGDIVFGDIDRHYVSRYQRMISKWYQTLNLNSAQIMLLQDRQWMQSSDSTTLLPTPALQTTFESYPLTSHSNHVDASQVQSPSCEPVDGQSSQNIPEHATPSLGTIFEQNAESRSSTHSHHFPNGASGALNVTLHQYNFIKNETDTYENNNTLESPDLPQ
ncbi:hypothetical protein DPMN_119941 [Dreissena polymorpha]|uniref:Uncharacterized protein n=1 Tax=Dreissena polymorpha TaxID=45954 RepID=A0A9D4GJP2_DREPO|nr:hypothetical protein DPMN_119941 [Dreissena polymorpha]